MPEEKRPCNFCLLTKPEHNPIAAQMNEIGRLKKEPKKISTNKIFVKPKKKNDDVIKKKKEKKKKMY